MRDLPDTYLSRLYALNLRTMDNKAAMSAATDAVELLYEMIGGERVYWPQSNSQRTARDKRIRALAGAGTPHAVIAERVGLSRKRVDQIVRG